MPSRQPQVGLCYQHAAAGLVRIVGVECSLDPLSVRVVYQATNPETPWQFTQDLDEWCARTREPVGARPSWDDYFIQMCHLVATRATCDRKHVGAVLVRDRRVIATGYNGSAPGEPHCDDVGHDLVAQANGVQNCVRTIHAEANAILQAAKYGVSVQETTLFTNTYPCWPCAKMILSAGIVEVVVDTDYNNDPRVEAAFATKGVPVRRYKNA